LLLNQGYEKEDSQRGNTKEYVRGKRLVKKKGWEKRAAPTSPYVLLSADGEGVWQGAEKKGNKEGEGESTRSGGEQQGKAV